MRKSQTRNDYQSRVRRVGNYIDAHLDEDLDLEKLAGIACYSPYHWHRIYRALAGETAAQTVRRLRLHRAATALISTNRNVGQIARAAGYASVEAFTRAFSAAHGAPPGSFRRAGAPPADHINNLSLGKLMTNVRIETRPATRLATISHTGNYMQIAPVFARLLEWAGARNLLGPESVGIGVYYDDPAATPEAELRSEAGITVADNVGADETVKIITLQAGRHAILRHTGPYEDLPTTYAALYGTWLPTSGEEAADQPSFEIYLNDPQTTAPDELETDLCLPLKPRSD